MAGQMITAAQQLAKNTKANRTDDQRAFRAAQKELGELIKADIGKWYKRASELCDSAESEQVKFWLIQLVLNKVAPDKKQTERIDLTDPSGQQQKQAPSVVFNIQNVNRGTKQAREEAIEVRAKRVEDQKRGVYDGGD